MSDGDQTTLLERLETLERQNRRFKQFTMLVMMGFASLFIMGQAQDGEVPEVIRARNFEVIGDNGNVFLKLEAVGDRNGAITLFDAEDRVLSSLAGNLFLVFDRDGGQLYQLYPDENGGGQLWLFRKGQTLVSLGGTEDGRGLMQAFNAEGARTVVVGSDVEQHGFIVTFIGEQRVSVLGATADGGELSKSTIGKDSGMPT